MSGLVWASSMTLPVYAVGDGLFMQRVMNAIAALSNSGVLASLGLLGFMMGLLLMVMKAMQTGGREVEIPSIFTSLILYGLMFGGTCNVMINDVDAAPGQYANAVYVVDHVPFGMAVMGWVISNVSYELSEKLEQAYSLPGATDDDVMHVGFNRTLDWLTAVRIAENPGADSTDHTLSRFKTDVVGYLAYCTSKELKRNPQLINTISHTSDPFNTTDGMGSTSTWDFFPYYDLIPNSINPASQMSCGQGIGLMKTYATTNLFNAVTSAAAVGNKLAGSSSAQTQAANAWQLAGGSQDAGAQFYAAGIINDSLHTALAGIPVAGDMQINNSIMIDTANAQRATQFSGQESMFRSLMRPLMAFFESLVYIAAPFMVMAIGLGGFGVRLVGRYAMATVWVSMWMPTLAAINLYQQTAVDEVLGPFLNAPPSSTGSTFHAVSSLFGANMAYGQLDNLIATGALLAASTPAITGFLLFASVQAMSGVFNSAGGGSAMNPKVATPDTVNTPATMDRRALMEHTQVGGTSAVGSVATPTLSLSTGSMLSSAEATQASDQLGQTFSRNFGSQASHVIGSFFGSSGGVSSTATSAMTDAANRVVAAAKADGYSMTTAEAIGMISTDSSGINNNAGWGVSGGVSGGGMIKGMPGGGGGTPGVVQPGESGSIMPGVGNFGATGGVDMNSGTSASTGSGVVDSRSSNHGIGRNQTHNLSASKGVQAAVSEAQQSLVQFAAQHGSQEADALTKNSSYASVASKMSSLSHSYSQTGTASSGIGLSQPIELKPAINAVGNMFTDPSGHQDLGAATAYMSGKAQAAGVSHGRIVAAQQALMSASGMDQQHAMLGGVMIAMANPAMPGESGPEKGSQADRDARLTQQAAMSELVGVLSRAGADQLGVGGAGSVNPDRGSIGVDANQAANVKSDVMAHAPGANEKAVSSSVHGAAGASASGLVDGAARYGHMQAEAADAQGAGANVKATVVKDKDGNVDSATFDKAHSGTEKQWKDENFQERLNDRRAFNNEQQSQPRINTDMSLGLIDTAVDAIKGK